MGIFFFIEELLKYLIPTNAEFKVTSRSDRSVRLGCVNRSGNFVFHVKVNFPVFIMTSTECNKSSEGNKRKTLVCRTSNLVLLVI